jgi:hypothetical protein
LSGGLVVVGPAGSAGGPSVSDLSGVAAAGGSVGSVDDLDELQEAVNNSIALSKPKTIFFFTAVLPFNCVFISCFVKKTDFLTAS